MASRPNLDLPDNSVPTDEAAKRDIIEHFEKTLDSQGFPNWKFSEEGRRNAMSGISLTKKHSFKPRIIFVEFNNFTSNNTWCRYMNGVNPFQDFVFLTPSPIRWSSRRPGITLFIVARRHTGFRMGPAGSGKLMIKWKPGDRKLVNNYLRWKQNTTKEFFSIFMYQNF